jgi:hypothetical protein
MPWITVVAEPPPQYTLPYRGPVIERVLPLAEARRLCASRGVRSDGCAWVSRGKCYIVIPTGGPVRDLSAYRRHEIAHCNGWSHGHGHRRHYGSYADGPGGHRDSFDALGDREPR